MRYPHSNSIFVSAKYIYLKKSVFFLCVYISLEMLCNNKNFTSLRQLELYKMILDTNFIEQVPVNQGLNCEKCLF